MQNRIVGLSADLEWLVRVSKNCLMIYFFFNFSILMKFKFKQYNKLICLQRSMELSIEFAWTKGLCGINWNFSSFFINFAAIVLRRVDGFYYVQWLSLSLIFHSTHSFFLSGNLPPPKLGNKRSPPTPILTPLFSNINYRSFVRKILPILIFIYSIIII